MLLGGDEVGSGNGETQPWEGLRLVCGLEEVEDALRHERRCFEGDVVTEGLVVPLGELQGFKDEVRERRDVDEVLNHGKIEAEAT